MTDAREVRVSWFGWRWCALALAVGVAAATPTVAQDTCDVVFQLDDPGPMSRVAFSADYGTVPGGFVGDSTIPGFGPSWGTEPLACASLVPVQELTALDDNAGVLNVFVAAEFGASFVGPLPIVTCILALDSGFPCPTAGDFVIGDHTFPDVPPTITLPSAPAISVTVSPRIPVCGDGFREGAEQCDDGNASDGDCCTSTCAFDAAATPCSDASVCTSGETCDGAGACVPGSTLSCDDGLPCTHDVCDPSLGCQALSKPDPACREMKKLKLRVSDKEGETADRVKITAKMSGPLSAIGDPTTTTGYTICVFDDADGVGSTPLQIDVPAGPPWAPGRGGGSFVYTDASRASDGVDKIRLRARQKAGSANADVKFMLRGKGPNLALPGPVAPEAYFSADPSVTVQIVPSDASDCWNEHVRTMKNNGSGFVGKH